MTYHIYRTEGVILSSSPAGEANRFYHCYTKDHGLIGIWGQGVRKLGSKLRPNLQDLTTVRVHIVRGKDLWRLTDIDHLGSFPNIYASRRKRLTVGNVAALMKRLLEEEADPALYRLFVSWLACVNDRPDDQDGLVSLETLFVLRLLHRLGYGKESVPKDLALSEEWTDALIEHVRSKRGELVRIANSALLQTHM